MNNWNPLERQLRSWKPRVPAPQLKARLFPAHHPAGPPAPEEVPIWPGPVTWEWLAPAMALFVFMMFLTKPGAPVSSSRQLVFSSNHISEQTVREASLVSYLADTAHSPHNNCQHATLEWTNGDESLTTTAPVLGTNGLFQ